MDDVVVLGFLSANLYASCSLDFAATPFDEFSADAAEEGRKTSMSTSSPRKASVSMLFDAMAK